jgi:hypothetical protein
VSAEEFQRALMTTAIDAWVDSGHTAPAPVIDPAATIAGDGDDFPVGRNDESRTAILYDCVGCFISSGTIRFGTHS